MDDEFALCWNNFQDNIATGFQNLYDRGDLVDVTIACDGKLVHAHKIVLAICSPYFQEMFITNPCKHPIIILKDVAYSVMCELLQFMYQGVVNVKHTELSSFMKIAQTLQVKGLATSASSSSSSSQKSPSHHPQNANSANNNKNGGNGNNNNSTNSDNSAPPSGPLKRTSNEFNSNSAEGLSIFPKKQMKRYSDVTNDHDTNNDSVDNMNSDDAFMPPIPQISMIESRFDLNSVKRESNELTYSPSGMRNALPPPFNFDYGMYGGNKNIEYPNDLHMTNDYPKGAGNHMDIPSVGPGEKWFHGKLEFMLSQRGKPLLVYDGHTFGIQYIRKDKKYWQCNLSRKFNCKARVTTTENGEIIVTNNEHCHTEIRQHLRKDYHRNKFQGHIATAAAVRSNSSINSNNNNNNNNSGDRGRGSCENSNPNNDSNDKSDKNE